jgi:CBS domain-containing protein
MALEERTLELMREHEVQRLPVVEGGAVVGVVSLADVAFERPDEERGTVG